jgi:hypothetical protein
MFPDSELVDKQIIYRYSRSFDFDTPDIGLFKTRGAMCSMVIQQQCPLKLITDGLLATRIVTHNAVECAYSKTIEFSSAVFDKLYEDIVSSLAALSPVDFPTGEDGDALSVEIKDFRGHSCIINVWAPHESQDDRYHFNAIYAGFVEVLEFAGLLDWYAQ